MGVIHEGGLHPYAKWLIRNKARGLARKHGFRPSEQEDIEQELCCHLLQQVDRYDSDRGAESTFVDRVIGNCVRSMIENRHASKRSCDVPIVSLDEHFGVTTDMDRHEVIDREIYLEVTGRISRPDIERQDLAIDIARAVSALPPDLRELALLLMQYTIAEVSRRTGIPRTTINDRRDQIRQILEARGLGEYLQKAPSHSNRFR